MAPTDGYLNGQVEGRNNSRLDPVIGSSCTMTQKFILELNSLLSYKQHRLYRVFNYSTIIIMINKPLFWNRMKCLSFLAESSVCWDYTGINMSNNKLFVLHERRDRLEGCY